MSSSLPSGISSSPSLSAPAYAAGAAAAARRVVAPLRRAADDLRPPVLRFVLPALFFALRLAAPLRAAPVLAARLLAARLLGALFLAALLLAVLRDAPARLRAVLLVLRAAADLRPALLLR